MRTIWAILLIAFVALNLYALATAGVGALLSYPTTLSVWGVVATLDLVLALCVGMYWTALDARRRGVSGLPFIILTLLTGSVGLLAYLAIHSATRGSGTRPMPRDTEAKVSALGGVS
jgi:hypothetical protein